LAGTHGAPHGEVAKHARLPHLADGEPLSIFALPAIERTLIDLGVLWDELGTVVMTAVPSLPRPGGCATTRVTQEGA
jgi:hypothetical protein